MPIVDTLEGRMIDSEDPFEDMGWWGYVVRVDGEHKLLTFGDAQSYNRLESLAEEEWDDYEIITAGTPDPDQQTFIETVRQGDQR